MLTFIANGSIRTCFLVTSVEIDTLDGLPGFFDVNENDLEIVNFLFVPLNIVLQLLDLGVVLVNPVGDGLGSLWTLP